MALRCTAQQPLCIRRRRILPRGDAWLTGRMHAFSFLGGGGVKAKTLKYVLLNAFDLSRIEMHILMTITADVRHLYVLGVCWLMNCTLHDILYQKVWGDTALCCLTLRPSALQMHCYWATARQWREHLLKGHCPFCALIMNKTSSLKSFSTVTHISPGPVTTSTFQVSQPRRA